MPNLRGPGNGDPVSSVMLMIDSATSPNAPAVQMLATLIGFTPLYAILGIIWFVLMKCYAPEGIRSSKKTQEGETVDALSFGY